MKPHSKSSPYQYPVMLTPLVMPFPFRHAYCASISACASCIFFFFADLTIARVVITPSNSRMCCHGGRGPLWRYLPWPGADESGAGYGDIVRGEIPRMGYFHEMGILVFFFLATSACYRGNCLYTLLRSRQSEIKSMGFHGRRRRSISRPLVFEVSKRSTLLSPTYINFYLREMFASRIDVFSPSRFPGLYSYIRICIVTPMYMPGRPSAQNPTFFPPEDRPPLLAPRATRLLASLDQSLGFLGWGDVRQGLHALIDREGTRLVIFT